MAGPQQHRLILIGLAFDVVRILINDEDRIGCQLDLSPLAEIQEVFIRRGCNGGIHANGSILPKHLVEKRDDKVSSLDNEGTKNIIVRSCALVLVLLTQTCFLLLNVAQIDIWYQQTFNNISDNIPPFRCYAAC